MKRFISILMVFTLLLFPVMSFAEDAAPGDVTDIRLSYEEAYLKMKNSDTWILMDLSNKADKARLKELGKTSGEYSNASYLDDTFVAKTAEGRYRFAEKVIDANALARENALNLEVYEKYFNLKYLEDSIVISLENLNAAQDALKTVQIKYKQGSAGKNELLSAQIRVNEAKNQLDAAQNNLEKAQMDFNVYLGYDIDRVLVLTDTATECQRPEIRLEEAEKLAIENRLDVKYTEYNWELAQAEYRHAQVAYGAGSSKYLSAYVLYMQNKILHDRIENVIRMDVRSCYNDMNERYNTLQLCRENNKSCEESLSVGRARYKLGLITLNDLQTYENAVYEAKLKLSGALYSYNLAVQKYIYSYGVGTEPVTF